MWFVAIERPYYPSIDIVETEEEAKNRYQELFEEHEYSGVFDSKIMYGEIRELHEIKTNY